MLRRTVTTLAMLVAATLLLATVAAGAIELPTRKAGLWELKMLRAGSAAAEVTMQQCTDEATDKQMTANFSPMAKQNCSRNDTQKTATGYVTDSVCSFGGSTLTSHTEITGDFNSAYDMKVTSSSDKATPAAPAAGTPAPAAPVQGTPAPPTPASGTPAENVVTLQAKWLGPCAADQRPGDIVMPGGFRMNIKDMEKLKGLLPKQ